MRTVQYRTHRQRITHAHIIPNTSFVNENSLIWICFYVVRFCLFCFVWICCWFSPFCFLETTFNSNYFIDGLQRVKIFFIIFLFCIVFFRFGFFVFCMRFLRVFTFFLCLLLLLVFKVYLYDSYKISIRLSYFLLVELDLALLICCNCCCT